MRIILENIEDVEIGKEGTEEMLPGVRLSIAVEDIYSLIAIYNPASSTSPPAADCRALVRELLNIIASRNV